MKPTPRAILIARLTAILLLGLGAAAVGRLVFLLTLDPDMWSGVWDSREGGPLALIASLIAHWFDVLTARALWTRSGPQLSGAIAGALLLFLTRPCLRRLPGWALR